MSFLFVGLGGAIGAILRYALSLLPLKNDFPFWTLLTNFLGAVAIGFIAQTASKIGLSENTVLFLKTGVCGGFTTFSTFSLEAYRLFQNKKITIGAVYILLSVVLCLGGIALGMWLSNIKIK